MSLSALMLVLPCALLAATDPTGGYPNWEERSLLVLTNACRMDPTEFRDTYVGSYNILLPANYPPAPPLFWNYALNQCARTHAVDQANNCGLSHNSCDGTQWDDRIDACYSFKSPKIGENIASGPDDPLGTMEMWIKDGNPPPADGNSDGHRQNIMDANFKELGCGYAYGPVQYRHFWVQDLGGGAPEVSNNIVAGSHFFFTSGTTTFMAVYYDDANSAPSQATLVLGGTEYQMSLHMGTAARGVYTLDQSSAGSCRYYYFEFEGGGQVWRYPETGYLATHDEGSCSEDYNSMVTPSGRKVQPSTRGDIEVLRRGSDLVVLTTRRAVSVVLTDTQGRSSPARSVYRGVERSHYCVVLRPGTPLGPGAYLVVANYGQARPTVTKAVLLP